MPNPTRGQLNRENNIPLSPFAPENFSRETGSAVPSRVSLLILHTQAENGKSNLVSGCSPIDGYASSFWVSSYEDRKRPGDCCCCIPWLSQILY